MGCGVPSSSLSGGTFGGGSGAGESENIFQNPFAARHRRGSVGHRGHQKKTGLSQQAAARVVLYRNAAELAAVNARHPVMRRQALVDERVVGIQQVHDIAILPHDALKQQLGLTAEGLAQVLVEGGR